MVSYSAETIPPRGQRRKSAPRFPANHPGRPWTHYVNDHFFDRTDIEAGLERLAFRLERFAREKPYGVTSNDELCRQLGCSRNTLAALLNRGESLGWFRRVLVPGRAGRATARLGFVLFVRPTDRPVATPETFDQAADQLRAEIDQDRPRIRPRTLPFPEVMHRESTGPAPQQGAPAVPKNWAPAVPKNWAPPPCIKKETSKKTTTEATDAGSSSSSSSLDPEGPEPGEIQGLEAMSSGASPQPAHPSPALAEPPRFTVPIGASPRPAHPSPAPAEPPRFTVPSEASEPPAELVAAAAESVPGASREWVSGLLRGCGPHGVELALLVLAWVKRRRPERPERYAWTAMSGWLNRLKAGELTLEDVRAEVHGRVNRGGSPRPFDPSAWLARLESHGWTVEAVGADQVRNVEIPGRGAPLWKHLPGDLLQGLREHRAEVKAYALARASERGKSVALRA